MKNATFNLLPLYLNPKSQLKFYTVKDDRNTPDDPSDDYEYAFNVCGPVLEVPTGCTYDKFNGKDRKFCDNNTLTTYPDGTTNCSIPWSTIEKDQAGKNTSPKLWLNHHICDLIIIILFKFSAMCARIEKYVK